MRKPAAPAHGERERGERGHVARLEASRSRDTGGVGLGLAIAQAAIVAHGGTLMLENRVPHGLRATVTLPR